MRTTSFINAALIAGTTAFLSIALIHNERVDIPDLQHTVSCNSTAHVTPARPGFSIVAACEENSFSASNERQHFQFAIHSDGFVTSAFDKNASDFSIQMSEIKLEGMACTTEADSFSLHKDQLLVFRKGFIIQYLNGPTGLRQNFIVHNKPSSSGNLKITMKINANGLSIGCLNNEMFASDENGPVYFYQDLNVWDADHQMLNASMQLEDGSLAVIVDDQNAKYPITIDPVSTNPDVIAEGNQNLSYFGNAVACAGDVNGDGYDDVIVGAYNYDFDLTNEGGAFIYYGTATGMSTTPATTIQGNTASIRFGYAVASAGDVNNDGYSDVMVGAPLFTNGQTNEGRVSIYLGSAAGVNPVAATTIESNLASAQLGTSVSGAGDINNDGYDDIIAGANGYTNGQSGEGAVYVYLGSAAGINTATVVKLESNQSGASLGTSVARAGDVNQDGYDDIISGARDYDNVELGEGGAYIFHGGAAGITTTPARILESNFASAAFGSAVTGAGDVNNDGYDDVAVGASTYSNGQASEGKIYVYLGSATGIPATAIASFESNQVSALLGLDITGGGDLNNDGYDDIIAGAASYDNVQTDEGRIFIFQGNAAGINTTTVVTAESNQASANLGCAIGMGDFNNDNFCDAIVGVYLYDSDLSDEGAIFMYKGNNCTPSNFYPDADADGFGTTTGMVTSCTAPAGYCNNNLDCNDAAPLYNPNTIWYLDADADGYYSGGGTPIVQCTYPGAGYYYSGSVASGDCNDANNAQFPSGLEIADGVDNNCDGSVDEGLNIAFGGGLYNPQVNQNMGFDVAAAGDLNNDGFDDVVVGVYGYTGAVSNSGAVFIYHGTATGIDPVPAQILEGNSVSGQFGIAVACNGDLNNDGYNDLVVGEEYYDYLPGTTNSGAVWVYLGTASGIFNTVASDYSKAITTNRNFGARVRYAGDINGDHFDDIIVTSLNYSNPESQEGVATVIYGDATGIGASLNLECNQNFAYMGWFVAGAGDVNNDGFDDVLSAAIKYDNGQTDEGRVYVYHGSATGLNTTPATILESNQANAYYGSVSSAGDINSDGYDDIIIGADTYDNGQTDEGVVFVHLGSATGIHTTPDQLIEYNAAAAYFGTSVAFAGDVNADGYDDIITGGMNYYDGFSNEGGAWIFKGSPTGLITTPIATLKGNQADAHFGLMCASAGDVNNDGADDMIVGAPDFDNITPPTLNSGAAFVYLGICDLYFYADADGDGYGNNAVVFHGCTSPVGYVANNTDCNDANASIHPGAVEICNTIDDDCDAVTDEGAAPVITISAGGPTTFCQGSSVIITAVHNGTTLQWKKNGATITGATSLTYTAATTGSYTCVSSNACGSTTSSAILVTANKNPTASITAGGPTTFCAGGSVVLTETPTGGCSYQWFKGASSLAGATTTNYTATATGNYKCRVTKNATGCFKYSNIIPVSITCKSGNEVEAALYIFPNPTSDIINIQSGSVEEKIIELTNAAGQILQTISTEEVDIVIHVETLPAGIYFIKLRTGDDFAVQIFTKQ